MHPAHEIRIAAALLTRPGGEVLLVRKRGTTAFIQPGGKLEPGEEPVDTLCRELAEELGLAIAPSLPAYLGRYSAPAVNEPGHVVTAEIFHLETDSPVTPGAEIEEIVWTDPQSTDHLTLAPLTRDHVLPLCGRLLAREKAVPPVQTRS